MALYEGASFAPPRLRSGAVRRPVPAPAIDGLVWDVPGWTPSARARPIVRTRARPTLPIVGTIVLATAVAIVYLSQTLQAAATQYRIDQLLDERGRLLQELQSQQGTIARLGADAEIIQWAQLHGLDHLGRGVRVSAR